MSESNSLTRTACSLGQPPKAVGQSLAAAGARFLASIRPRPEGRREDLTEAELATLLGEDAGD